jgi:iron complex transport system ATP-binding protein
MVSEGLAAEQVTFSYGGAAVLERVSFACRRGEMLALAGPNGSGKTTLLKLLSGVLQPADGRVTLDGQDLRRISPRSLARRVAVLHQAIDPRLMYRVEDLVAMGRTPHLSFFGGLRQSDREAVERAVAAAGIDRLRARPFNTLSGGEQRRVMVAMALAQEMEFLLLDEPTVHMDLQHQHELLETLARLHWERKVGVVAVMHDLNLATLYFDRLAVLEGGRLVVDASSEEALSRPEVLSVFRAPLQVVPHPSAGVPQVLLDRDVSVRRDLSSAQGEPRQRLLP